MLNKSKSIRKGYKNSWINLLRKAFLLSYQKAEEQNMRKSGIKGKVLKIRRSQIQN